MLEKQIKIKQQEMSQGDMINCQVTDMDKFHAFGMALYVFLRETGVSGRRKGNLSFFLYGNCVAQWL